MVEIQKKLTPYNLVKMENKKNTFIVVHYVGAVSTAKNNALYYYNNRLKTSAHYFVDETSIWQSVEDCNRAWHCGGGLQGKNGHSFYGKCNNSNSIGIEMCCKLSSDGNWYFEAETVKNTIDLIKHLMEKYDIPIENVIRHYDVTGKNCPQPYINDNVWNEFKEQLKEKKMDLKKAMDVLKEKVGLEDKTIEFLLCYKFGTELITKLAKAVESGGA